MGQLNLGLTSTLGVCIGLLILGRHFLRRWLYLYYLRWARQSYRSEEALKIGLRATPFLVTAWVGICMAGHFVCPEIGLLGTILVPLIVVVSTRLIRARQRMQMEESFLSFIYALRGMTEVGWSLPTSLFTLAHGMDGAFSVHLRRYLRKYREGASLLSCLGRFRRRHSGASSIRALLMLELSYRNGLSLLPVLDSVLPTLESRFQMAQRQRALLRSVAVQGLTAMLMPYGVLYFIWVFEPSLLIAQRKVVIGTVMGVLAWQALGGWALKSCCRFK